MTTSVEPTECLPVDLAVGDEGSEQDGDGAGEGARDTTVAIVTPAVQDPAGPSQATNASEEISPARGTPGTNVAEPSTVDPLVALPSKSGFVPRTVFDFREMEVRWKAEQDGCNCGGKEPMSMEKKPRGSARAPGTVSLEQGERRQGKPGAGAAHQGVADHPSPFSQATSTYLRNMFGGPQSKRIEKLLVKYL